MNSILKRDSFNSLMSTNRKTKKSIAMRNGSIEADDRSPKSV